MTTTFEATVSPLSDTTFEVAQFESRATRTRSRASRIASLEFKLASKAAEWKVFGPPTEWEASRWESKARKLAKLSGLSERKTLTTLRRRAAELAREFEDGE